MRIIAGIFGGRRLKAEVSAATRPTSDRVREALGSALDARGVFAQARVLDLFAGTGALGLEALSRGAVHVVAVESDKRALRCIADNARALGVSDRVHALDLDLFAPKSTVPDRLKKLGSGPFSLVFADPPYALSAQVPALLGTLASAQLLTQNACVVIEHEKDFALDAPAGFEVVNTYRYGDTRATILARL